MLTTSLLIVVFLCVCEFVYAISIKKFDILTNLYIISQINFSPSFIYSHFILSTAAKYNLK